MPRKILKGFTLIELLVVVAIIGVISAIGVIAYSKYTKIAQIRAIKAQNNEMNNFIKTTMATQCISYSDVLKLKFKQNNQDKTLTAACNSSHNMYNGAWVVVSKMSQAFKRYFAAKSDFRNVIKGQTYYGGNVPNPYAMGGACPNRRSADITMKPGNHCISYEAIGSRDMSKNACMNKGYDAWVVIGSMLPDKSYYFSCVGKTW
jgi:prepilin-type N-terminal cleavage/methylation domain-containing protein